ncbi:hypothetical protein MJO28_017376 [Puccinia striiformis f. sp. tritici]|uniref:Uncharacterized protein n=3 Tax=Puccinia striiformis TaxID=27350 RepID=A0A0L0VE99_9BASI|nr:hypothetical protein MJO28_017376 [Puccinia striiformis f. sp. tritici]KNE97501.1 hypothetical protein PSTG_09189 [Puccinia striiformis f. sp. tritici PST-78]POV99680.1 hypothetical protein PSTT_13625 [Puccinia striiformis]POW09162.1 hypothetical protein PSHT_09273 [Puccinia striiformis]
MTLTGGAEGSTEKVAQHKKGAIAPPTTTEIHKKEPAIVFVIDSDEDRGDPILLDSDVEDNQPITIDTDDDADDDNDKITELQELEIEEINQANNIMEFVHASLDDNDSTSSDDEELEDREPLQLLWSMFQKDNNSKLDLPSNLEKSMIQTRAIIHNQRRNPPH